MASQYPEELKYSESHAWIRILEDGSSVLVGVTSYLLDLAGEIQYVELPEQGIEINANEEIGIIDLSENSQELYAPVSGDIIAINEELEDAPKLISTDPYGDGWICKIRLSDPSEVEDLMSAEEYQDFLLALEE